MLSVFEDSIQRVGKLITCEHCFLLIDPFGVLLKKSREYRGKQRFDIKEGMAFTEDSSGTNAIAMSMILKKAVYTFPKHHYCNFLRNYHFYSIPLNFNEGILAYLAVTASEQEINKELIAITDLLGYQIIHESKCKLEQGRLSEYSKVKLSCKQVSILKLIARGMTDKAIALELGLSFDTIRCHKKVLYRKLGANCSVEAVVKSLKLDLISINQIIL